MTTKAKIEIRWVCLHIYGDPEQDRLYGGRPSIGDPFWVSEKALGEMVLKHQAYLVSCAICSEKKATEDICIIEVQPHRIDATQIGPS